MKSGCERVWLPGEVREFLRECRAKSGVSVSGQIRDCVLRRCKDQQGVDADLDRFLLLGEFAGLEEERGCLRRMQNIILADHVYLRDYAKELVKGSFSLSNVEYRRSILSYPGAEKALPALEHVLGRRSEIGAHMCEIVEKLYPSNHYEQLTQFKDEYEKRERPVRDSEGSSQRDLQDEVRRLRSRRRDEDSFEGGERFGENT